MQDNERKKIRKKYINIALAVLGVVAAYIIASALIFKRVTIGYNIAIIVGLGVFWLIMDVVAPLKARDFDGKSQAQMDAYRKYAALDLLGYVGLMYFALAMRSNTSIYGALVYVVARMTRNRFRDEFEGTEAEAEAGPGLENEAAAEGTGELSGAEAQDVLLEAEAGTAAPEAEAGTAAPETEADHAAAESGIKGCD